MNKKDTNKHEPNFFVISAPSGAGKTSLVKALINQTADCKAAISHTTRPKRSEEIDGEDYHFVGTRRSIQKQIGNAVPSLLGEAIVKHLISNI